jgi:hypothetical protein
LVRIVRVDEVVAGSGLKEALAFGGNELTLSMTAPLKPLSELIVTV